ncbi:hypothetical protein [Pseudomonas sp. MWU12-2323]|uniref:hypothetical protein n=1 Tax=Pseudomonas sp. MWU12-2323 TaxID=2651296 RepID=UPI00128BBBD2|nr:hypothetical protein [Pseudomonas sp. MWU12-2323]MPQ69252.1 hypothetical protein [Pseudomonas sp. MWU12-2323]
MHKLTLVAFSAAILAGCASAPKQSVSTYTYDSTVHSGTVHVTDKQYTNEALTCAANWRDGEVYTPKGLPSTGRDKLKITIDLKADGSDNKSYTLDVPLALGSRVLAKDYQVGKSYMLGAETNGLVQQGDHFFYPDGYYIRVSQPAVQGWSFVSCIGIDHMYVLDSDLQSSTNPPVHLDRVVVPFVSDQEDQPVKVSFGSSKQHTVEIRAQP